jgi:RNA polymerase sigma factor (sigma-70 family)
VSLNEHVGGFEGGHEGPERGDLLEQASIPPVEEQLIHRAAVGRVRKALDELEEKEREVVTLRFGLDRDGEPRTLQEVGDMLDLSRERIRQIESRAKEKLRKSKRAGELRSYLN